MHHLLNMVAMSNANAKMDRSLGFCCFVILTQPQPLVLGGRPRQRSTLVDAFAAAAQIGDAAGRHSLSTLCSTWSLIMIHGAVVKLSQTGFPSLNQGTSDPHF
jgi:hypothetical protein